MSWGSWFGRIVRAGQPQQTQRRYIYASPQDTKMDVTTASRRQVLGLARYMYYNDPVVRGAIDCITRNSIGPGIKCQSRTADEGWNEATEEWFHNWSLACDVRGLLDFNTLQQVACRTMLRDNELFVILTDNGDGWPQLQLIEAHRCETPAYLGTDKRISDGVRINPQGRPLSYYIRTGDGDKFTEVQAADVIVLAERDRPDELRSISRLVSCLNLLQDRQEILEFETAGAKRAGAIGLALEGQGSTGFFGPDSTSDDGITTDKILGGGAIWNLPAGKTLKEIKNDRPGPNLQEFMDQFLRAAAAGLGLPYEYMWKADLSGPSQRFILAQAQRRFDEVSQAIITQLVSRVRLWALAKGIKRGDLTPPRGMDRWWNAVYHTPKRTTIDAGRDSAADREDLKLGIRTLADIAAERGDDWQEIVEQRIAEQVFIRARATEAGVDMAEIQNTGQKPAAPAPVTPPSAPAPADQTEAPDLGATTVTINMSAPVEITEPAAVLNPEHATEKTETFSMKDDPDLELSDKELDMVAKAVGLKTKPAKKKKKA
jgi:lambda family phage portal protein